MQESTPNDGGVNRRRLSQTELQQLAKELAAAMPPVEPITQRPSAELQREIDERFDRYVSRIEAMRERENYDGRKVVSWDSCLWSPG